MKNSKITIIAIVTVAFLMMAFQSVRQQSQPETMPLVPMMRLLLNDMYNIDEGIYTEDFAMIEKGGKAIADHPVMTEEDKILVKKTLGEKMQQFVKYDMIVHHHADSIALAAQRKEMDSVLNHYQIVQQGCVDCHTDFRKDIIEARE
ncbi:MAG: hypothetical protein ACNS64_11295 [Candidatus Halalkalibacterium sp. M3_1C_030]